MPAAENHIKLALHNLDVLQYMCHRLDFSDWIITVSGYTAIHLVETMFALECGKKTRTIHSISHERRNNDLRICYPSIWKKYRPLYNASLVARYLEDSAPDQEFSSLYPCDTVVNIFLKKYFAGIIREVETIIGDKVNYFKVNRYFQKCLEVLDKKTA